uniref:Uncharacterized protein n=1 Tax=Rhizophora mucronata TaxID=61149 RepID=A0A2P2KWX7_RHIMU
MTVNTNRKHICPCFIPKKRDGEEKIFDSQRLARNFSSNHFKNLKPKFLGSVQKQNQTNCPKKIETRLKESRI